MKLFNKNLKGNKLFNKNVMNNKLFNKLIFNNQGNIIGNHTHHEEKHKYNNLEKNK